MSKRKSSKISQASGSASGEGSENEYYKEVMELKKSISPATCWSNLYNRTENEPEDQMSTYVRLDVIGSALCERFAWAIPDNKALRIISTFSKKIIEIGCGKGYWLSLLQKSKQYEMESCVGVDKYAIEDPHIETVIKGTPSILQNKKYKEHTLLLCYPDQGEDVSAQCLEYYDGNIIIHIGELCMTHNSTKVMGTQAPFGRTTSSEFQVTLMAEWHMLLSYKLESFPFANDRHFCGSARGQQFAEKS